LDTTEATAVPAPEMAAPSPEDRLLDALHAYTEAVDDLEDFETEQMRLLGEYGALQEVIADREGKLKALAREVGPCGNYRFAVTVQRKSRRWFDVDYILEHAPWVRGIPGVVIETVDRAKIEALAKMKAIDADVCDAARREEALTPAVTIKRL